MSLEEERSQFNRSVGRDAGDFSTSRRFLAKKPFYSLNHEAETFLFGNTNPFWNNPTKPVRSKRLLKCTFHFFCFF